MSMKVYISGPMSGLPDYNYPEFFDLAEHLCRIGFEPINPATIPEQPTWERYMREATKLLMDADMVVFLPRWEFSRGANRERRYADDFNMPFAYAYRDEAGEFSIHMAPIGKGSQAA